MSKRECELTQRVAAESATASMSEELAAHAALCADCGETLRVARLMRLFADATPTPHALPPPGLLLWKSRMHERRAAQERATKPLVIVQAASCALAALTLLWWGIKNPSPLGEGLAALEPTMRGLLASFDLIAMPLLIACCCVTLTCLTLAYAFRISQVND